MDDGPVGELRALIDIARALAYTIPMLWPGVTTRPRQTPLSGSIMSVLSWAKQVGLISDSEYLHFRTLATFSEVLEKL